MKHLRIAQANLDMASRLGLGSHVKFLHFSLSQAGFRLLLLSDASLCLVKEAKKSDNVVTRKNPNRPIRPHPSSIVVHGPALRLNPK